MTGVQTCALPILLFGITFRPPDLSKLGNFAPALEIVLVNAKSKSRPQQADILAQHNLDGGGTTDLAVFEDRTIRHTAVIPFAGNQVTNDIRKGLGVLTEQAERLRTYQAAKAAEGELESVLSKFSLAAEVQKQKISEEGVGRIASAPAGVSSPLASNAPKGLRHLSSSFPSRKGGLLMPVEGKIVTAFGRKYDPKASLYTFHKGVDIAAPAGQPVQAVFAGKVVYSGKIGGYGQLLILDHGDQYYSLVGQLGEIHKREGDDVKEGETLGRSALDGAPVYFEIRQRHVAVNPVPWFAKGLSQQSPASSSN